MRELLRASVQLGVSPRLLAECLGTSQRAVRARANSAAGGTVTAELIEQLTDLTPRQLDRVSRGELTRSADPADHEGGASYRIRDVVRAVLSIPTTPSPG
ncbi:MAG: hypothetical protein M3237_11365 [Actinomycetota bacterium]|nr:hypothetical protein [Actinomycetota bacterium]